MNVFPPDGLTQITHRWPPRIVTSIPHIGNVSKFELLLNNDTPFFFDAATLMKSQMEKIGVEVKLTMTDKPPSIDRLASLFFRGAKSSDGGLESPEIEGLSIKWWREVSAEARKQITYDIQRAFAKDMLRCNIYRYRSALFPGIPEGRQRLSLHEQALRPTGNDVAR